MVAQLPGLLTIIIPATVNPLNTSREVKREDETVLVIFSNPDYMNGKNPFAKLS